jgi:hypothetical protein
MICTVQEVNKQQQPPRAHDMSLKHRSPRFQLQKENTQSAQHRYDELCKHDEWYRR